MILGFDAPQGAFFSAETHLTNQLDEHIINL